MKRAAALQQYSDMKAFTQPSGVVDVQLDKLTNLLATPSCPQTYSSAFIVGTEPTNTCDQNTGVKGVLSRFFGLGNEQVPTPRQRPTSRKSTGRAKEERPFRQNRRYLQGRETVHLKATTP